VFAHGGRAPPTSARLPEPLFFCLYVHYTGFRVGFQQFFALISGAGIDIINTEYSSHAVIGIKDASKETFS
jgi:hypothetical protein